MRKLPRLAAALLVTTSLLSIAPAVSLLTTGPTHSTQRADGPTERQFPGCLTCWEYGNP